MAGLSENVIKLFKEHANEIDKNNFNGLYAKNTTVYPPDITKVLIKAVKLDMTLQGVDMIYRSMFSEEIPDPYDKEDMDIVLPKNIKEIGGMGFGACRNLRTIVIPESVKSINDNAFWDCFRLEKVVIANGCEFIGEKAFCECRKLKSITLPETLDDLAPDAFENDISLEQVKVSKISYERKTEMYNKCLKQLIDSDIVEFY